ncbi:hypothetical protein PLESTM_000980000 [Pleodorina starrii]|nr:hypothetical protein PLESTM_000980000 [Pleodorina starrii]
MPTTVACVKPALTLVEVNGQRWINWETKAWIMPTGDIKYEFRMYGFEFNATTFPGTQFCLTVTDPCTSFMELCDLQEGSRTRSTAPMGNCK